MVNFTFVSHKGAKPEKRELVKSHVMRESQKRRREARKRNQNAPTSNQQCLRSDLSLSLHTIQGLDTVYPLPSGGTTTPGQDAGEIAVFHDMIHAACSNVPPTLIGVTAPTLREVQLRNLQNWCPQSPLRLLNDGDFWAPMPELQSSLGLLKDAFDAFEMLCIEVFDGDTAAQEAALFASHRHETWIRLNDSDGGFSGDLVATGTSKTHEAVRLAAKIHFRAVALRIAHADDINVDEMESLHHMVGELAMGAWEMAPYIYLWVLLTGGAAANKQPDCRPWFESELQRLGSSIGLSDAAAFKRVLGNFLWIQGLLDRKERYGDGFL